MVALGVLTHEKSASNFTHYPLLAEAPMGELARGERLQIMLSEAELAALDDWRFSKRMPSRASAIRELLKRGLQAEGFTLANSASKSKDFGIISETRTNARKAR
jgi:hypothetical protein